MTAELSLLVEQVWNDRDYFVDRRTDLQQRGIHEDIIIWMAGAIEAMGETARLLGDGDYSGLLPMDEHLSCSKRPPQYIEGAAWTDYCHTYELYLADYRQQVRRLCPHKRISTHGTITFSVGFVDNGLVTLCDDCGIIIDDFDFESPVEAEEEIPL